MANGESIYWDYNQLDILLRQKEVLPEDVHEREKLLRPLELTVASLEDVPQVPHDTVAGKLITLLWCKSHPSAADLDVLISDLKSESPLVRLLAVDALSATLAASHQQWSKPSFIKRAKQDFAESREGETSPIITYKLAQLTEKTTKLLQRPKKKGRQQSHTNPYVAGLPVHGPGRFFGRDDILNEIKNSFVTHTGVKSIVLYGARRTGKTSVLFQIRDGFLGESFLSVYLDMQALAGVELQAFLRTLLLNTYAALKEHVDLLGDDLLGVEGVAAVFSLMLQFFRRILSRLDGRKLLLMIDEYEVLSHYLAGTSDLARQMQSLLEQEPNLYAIFAGSQKLETLRMRRLSILLDNSRYMKISFMKRNEATRLIKEPAEGTLEYADEAAERILYYTNGHPFYTQLLCQWVFDSAIEDGTARVENVEEAVRQFLYNPSPHLILTWNGLEIKQKLVGSALGELQNREGYPTVGIISQRLKANDSPMKLAPSEIQKAINELRDIDWVQRQEGTHAYGFTMNLVRRWVADNRSLLDLVEELREQVASKIADVGQQVCGLLADLLAVGLITVLLVTIKSSINRIKFVSNEWLYLLVVWVSYLYLFMPVLLSQSTAGQKLLSMRAVRASGSALDAPRAALYSLLLLGRLFTAIFFFYLLIVSILYGPSVNSALLLVVLTLPLSLDILMLLFGRRHQGLCEKLARVLIVRASTERGLE